jgi:hypothetical protein
MRKHHLAVFVMFFTLGACSHSVDPGDLVNTVVQDSIAYTVELAGTTYSVTDTVAGRFTIENQSTVRRSFKFSNMQQYGYRLRELSGRVVLSEPSIVSPALSAFELDPGQRRAYELHLLLRDHTGRWMVPGRYTLEVFLLDGTYPSVSFHITIV